MIRRRVLPVAIALTFSLWLPSTVLGQNGPYVSAQAGGVFLQDGDAGIVDNIEFDTGIFGALALGYDFGEKYGHSRIEGEFAYRQNHIDNMEIFGKTQGAYGKIRAASFLANAYYAFENPTLFKPFLMGGLGAAWAQIDNAETLGVVVIDDDDIQFAYQAGAGISLDLASSLAVDLGYKFFSATAFQFQDEVGQDAEFSYKSHNAYLGLRYIF